MGQADVGLQLQGLAPDAAVADGDLLQPEVTLDDLVRSVGDGAGDQSGTDDRDRQDGQDGRPEQPLALHGRDLRGSG
ncbi:hypothetical protein BRD09_00750 [Halobacteriales archaeon SW_10_68_16]|nr:MAG: hypothetical protein BRD09_00750 [Halobacteriales archaeon SW_10_68_16]